jgi:hypothetical protein
VDAGWKGCACILLLEVSLRSIEEVKGRYSEAKQRDRYTQNMNCTRVQARHATNDWLSIGCVMRAHSKSHNRSGLLRADHSNPENILARCAIGRLVVTMYSSPSDLVHGGVVVYEQATGEPEANCEVERR